MKKRPVICAYCENEIQPPESAVMVNDRPCCKGCVSKMKVQLLLERDPQISRRNDRFRTCGAVGLLLGLLGIFFLFFSSLAGTFAWPHWLRLTLGIIGLLLMLSFVVLFVIRIRDQKFVMMAVKEQVPDFDPRQLLPKRKTK